MGLLSPVLITGKLIFQYSWCRGVGWDALLPDDLGSLWISWLKHLPDFRGIYIPRCVGTRGKENCQIHVFCDASERAYGAVLYIRLIHRTGTGADCIQQEQTGSPKESHPPRLELIVALIGAFLRNNFAKRQDSSRDQYCGRTQPWLWDGYVATPTGVTEIQIYTTPSQWRHCPGEENPTDLFSQGVTTEHLKQLRN